MRRRRLPLLVLVPGLTGLLTACSPAGAVPHVTPLPSSCPGQASPIKESHESSTELLQACDYRFDPGTLVLTKGSIVKVEIQNTSSVLHNFTVVGTKIDVDVNPGDTSKTIDLGKHLAPGSYVFYCKYYLSKGMQGVLVVNATSPG